jgi:hypothetical protein
MVPIDDLFSEFGLIYVKTSAGSTMTIFRHRRINERGEHHASGTTHRRR